MIRFATRPLSASPLLLLLALGCGTPALRPEAPSAVAPAGADLPSPDPAPVSARVRAAVQASVPLLQSSGRTWIEEASCISCHHTALGTMAVRLAGDSGFAIDEEALEEQYVALETRSTEDYVEVFAGHPSLNPNFGQSYKLLALAAAERPRDDDTDASFHFLAANQNDDGSWRSDTSRPPLESSPVTATALAARALLFHAPDARRDEVVERVLRARSWLVEVDPESTEETVMKLLGLRWTGAPEGHLDDVAGRLLAQQRRDGGWSQLSTRESDAYATGQAMVALELADRLPMSARTRARDFLLDTQESDGSWLVETRRRAPGLPYVDSGFPHRQHQFISYAGSAWATLALLFALDPAHATFLTGSRLARAEDDAARRRGMQPLHEATAFGDEEAFARALAAAPDVDLRGPGGLTPLMLAVHDAERFDRLLDRGADPKARTEAGYTVLHFAASTNGASRLVERLLALGADPDAVAGTLGTTPLLRSVRCGDLASTRALLAGGASVDLADGEATTPFLAATYLGSKSQFDELLAYGADPGRIGLFEGTALHFAAFDGHTDLVERLLDAAVPLDVTDELGMTPLAWAAKLDHAGTRQIAQALLAAGADPDVPSEGGRTALEWAEHFGNERVARLLRAVSAKGSGAAEAGVLRRR